MIIRVTQEHIDRGLRGSCSKCPVALALKDSGLENVWVSVTLKYNKGTPTSLVMPDSVKSFIFDFDAPKPVNPFEFEIPDAA